MDQATAFLLAAERRGLLSPEQSTRARRVLETADLSDGPEGVGRVLVAEGLLRAADLGSILGDLGGAGPAGDATVRAAPAAGDVGASAATLLGPPAATILRPPAAATPAAPPAASESDVTRRGPAATADTATLPARPAPPRGFAPVAGTHAVSPADGFPYQPRETLGRGGMGHVWAALDPSLGREVAIKTILEPRDANTRSRFLAEARVTGQLEHPNIIPVHELGDHPERGPYLVMKRIRGRSLKAVLSDLAERKSDLRLRKSSHRPADGPDGPARPPANTTATALAPRAPEPDRTGSAAAPVSQTSGASPPGAAPDPRAAQERGGTQLAAVPLDNALPWLLGAFVKICEAMAYAHSRGVIHRDLKPENIMMGEFGEVLVMDWGLAKVLGHAETPSGRLRVPAPDAASDGFVRTLDGEVVGTPMYMPPEQAQGRVDALDERSDVYSLGAILYELLTLNQPFEGKDIYDLLRRVRDGAFGPPRTRNLAPWEVPREMEAVVQKAMARAPEGRYSGVLELKADVEAYLAGRRLSAAEYSAWDLLVKWAKRNKAAVSTGSAAAALLIVATVFFLVSVTRARDDAIEKGRQAEIHWAESLASQADAVLTTQDWIRARNLYRDARVKFDALGLPGAMLDWGLTAAYRINPSEILTVEGWEGDLRAVAVSPDGRQFLTGGSALLALCDAATGRRVRSFAIGNDPVHSIAFSPDGRTAVTGQEHGKATLWDLAAGSPLRTFKGHIGRVLGAAVFPDGRKAISVSEDHSVRIWDVSQNHELGLMRGHMGPVCRVLVTPDGRRALSAGRKDGTLRLWDMTSGLELQSIPIGQPGIWGFAEASDGRRAVSTAQDQTIKLWDLTTLREEGAWKTRWHTSAAFSPDGRQVLFGGQDGVLTFWDLAGHREVRRIPAHRGWITAVRFGPGPRDALSAGADGLVKSWDLERGVELRTFAGHTGMVGTFGLSPDGRYMASPGQDQTVRVWELATGREVRTLRGHTQAVGLAVFTPDGRYFLCSSGEGTLRRWGMEQIMDPKVDQVRESYVHRGEGMDLGDFTVLPDGERVLAAVHADGSLTLWDFGAPRRYRAFEGRLKTAAAKLQSHPDDPESLHAFGEWYVFRGVWDWAAELLERASRAGADADPLLQGACYWRLGRYEDARRAFRRVRDDAGQEPGRCEHVRLCLGGVDLAEGRAREREALLPYARPIEIGRHEGRLDEASASARGRRLQRYAFYAYAGEHVRFSLSSTGMKPLLVVYLPDADGIATGPTAGTPNVAEVVVTVPGESLCIIECTTPAAGPGGAYVLELSHLP